MELPDCLAKEYPVHAELARVHEYSQGIGEFISNLAETTEYLIGKYDEDGVFRPVELGFWEINDLLFSYFKLDKQKYFEEKRRMAEILSEVEDL